MQCCGWIDLYALGDIRVIGSLAAPFVVHADQTLSNGSGGIITVKS